MISAANARNAISRRLPGGPATAIGVFKETASGFQNDRPVDTDLVAAGLRGYASMNSVLSLPA
jgi:hypothetical protein